LVHTKSLYQAGTVHLDCAHAESKIVSDHLVWPACQERVENLPFARTERRKLVRRIQGVAGFGTCPAGERDASIALSRTSSSNGFSMKSAASAFIARTAL
jgi:hypothetical protein